MIVRDRQAGASTGALALARAVITAALITAALAACQDRRNEFNPIKLLCPGDFDADGNQCVIQTGTVEEAP